MAQKQAKESIPTAVVVNDDVTQLKVLSELVLKAGLEPVSFTGAEAALKAMDPEDPPALIVTDLYMPGIDGWRFCRLLRSAEYEALNQIPIVVVSATFAGEEPERIALELGAEAFISSPVDGRLFVRQIKAILRGEIKRVAPRALIVEDGKVLASVLKKAFVSEGYRVDVAYLVQEATDAFANARYDVAVIDYHLPDGTGDGLLDLFRSLRPDCACLMMTTNPGAALALEWMKRGAAAYIQKPFDPAYLLELCARARRERALLRAEDLLEERTLELSKSEKRFKTLFDESPVSIIIHDKDTGEIIDANEKAFRFYGLTSLEELRENEFWTDPPYSADDALRFIHKAAAEGMQQFQWKNRKINGEVFWEHVTLRLVDIGGVERVLSVAIDITERKKGEETLCRERERLTDINSALLNLGPDYGSNVNALTALCGRLLNGTCALYNRLDGDFLCSIGQWHTPPDYNPEDSPEGHICFDVIRSGDRNAVVVRNLAETHYAQTDPNVSKYGLRTYIGHPVMCGGQAVGSLCVVFQDDFIPSDQDLRILGILSSGLGAEEDRKRAEKEREKLQAQLTQAQKMESVGRLAGGVAHDFNNMLGIILGHTDMALEYLEPGQPVHSDLMEIRKATKRSADLVRRLLAFARKQTIAPKVLDLNDTVEGMLKMLRRLIGENIDLSWMPGKKLWPVNMDPTQIDQVLANLCVNARDAIEGVGKVTIETDNVTLDEDDCDRHLESVPGDYVLLAVSDDGSGMEKEILDKIFDPFFTTKEVGKGTGLGLPMIYGIVKQNEGFINVYSEPGRGTIFRIYIPRHSGEAKKEQMQVSDETIRGGDESILLVEDEPMLLQMGKEMLQKLGYRVLAAGSPSEALRIAAEHKEDIRLLITDVIMPGMNGRELADQLSVAYPDMKLIFMSGYTADVIAHHGVLDFGVKFIQKPFSMKDLATRIRESLES